MSTLCGVIDGNDATSTLFEVTDGVKLSPSHVYTKEG